MEAYTSQVIATFLVSLRIAPTLAFAPPFTLLRTPTSLRLFLALGLSLWIVLGNPSATYERTINETTLIPMGLSELLLGVSLSLSLHLAFAALQVVGRTIDFQIGFGLAVLADPTLRTQMPLVGALFAYAAGALFFATSGPDDLVTIWAQSLQRIPLGAAADAHGLSALLEYISVVFGIAIGVAGLAMLALFLLDLCIALISRTLPQLNVLVLGFQIKTLALLATLPVLFAVSGADFLRMVRVAINGAGRFW